MSKKAIFHWKFFQRWFSKPKNWMITLSLAWTFYRLKQNILSSSGKKIMKNNWKQRTSKVNGLKKFFNNLKNGMHIYIYTCFLEFYRQNFLDLFYKKLNYKILHSNYDGYIKENFILEIFTLATLISYKTNLHDASALLKISVSQDFWIKSFFKHQKCKINKNTLTGSANCKKNLQMKNFFQKSSWYFFTFIVP